MSCWVTRPQKAVDAASWTWEESKQHCTILVAVGYCWFGFEAKAILRFKFKGDEFQPWQQILWGTYHNSKEILLAATPIFWPWKWQPMSVPQVINPVWCFVLLTWCKAATVLHGFRPAFLDGNGAIWGLTNHLKGGWQIICYPQTCSCMFQHFPARSSC